MGNVVTMASRGCSQSANSKTWRPPWKLTRRLNWKHRDFWIWCCYTCKQCCFWINKDFSISHSYKSKFSFHFRKALYSFIEYRSILPFPQRFCFQWQGAVCSSWPSQIYILFTEQRQCVPGPPHLLWPGVPETEEDKCCQVLHTH